MFFAVIEGIVGIVIWRRYLKAAVVHGFLRVLRDQKFPLRYYKHDDFLNYLARVADDERSSERVKWEARAMKSMLAMHENIGARQGARYHAASEIALELYSPRAHAPVYKPL